MDSEPAAVAAALPPSSSSNDAISRGAVEVVDTNKGGEEEGGDDKREQQEGRGAADDEDETRATIDAQLDRCYVYQNPVTGSPSAAPLTVRQLCLILSPPSASASTNRAIHGGTLVIGWVPDPAGGGGSYSPTGWVVARDVPVLREACSSWHYEDDGEGEDDDGGGGGRVAAEGRVPGGGRRGGAAAIRGPVSARTLADLVRRGRERRKRRRQRQGKKGGADAEGGDSDDGDQPMTGGGRGSAADISGAAADDDDERRGLQPLHVAHDRTRVWSAEIAASAQQQAAASGDRGAESLAQWRAIADDVNLRVALEAFRAPGQPRRQPPRDDNVDALGEEDIAAVDVDPSAMVYDDERDGGDGAPAAATGTAGDWSRASDAISTASTIGAGSAVLDPQRVHDELDAFLASTGGGGVGGGSEGGKSEHDYGGGSVGGGGGGEHADHDEEEEFQSDGGTNYVKSRRTGEWIPSSVPNGSGGAPSQASGGGEAVGSGGNDHQLAGGPISAAPPTTDQKPKKKKKNKKAKFAARNARQWIYVTGLPADTDEDEVRAHFARAGIIDLDPESQRPKIKLYRHKGDGSSAGAGQLKGDASICYARPESVELAVQVLDGSVFRPTSSALLSVTRAKFEQKGDKFDGSHRPRASVAKRKVARLAAVQAVDWDEGEHGRISGGQRGLRIIVLKGVFSLDVLERSGDEDAVLAKIEADLRAECEEKFGTVEKITVFARNPMGVVVVKFAQPPAATAAVKELDGRRSDNVGSDGGPLRGKIEATFWDGVTDYTVRDEEKDAKEMDRRQEEFGHWLETQELPEEFRLKVEGE